MAIKVSKELYDNGYRLDGEGRRVDIVDLEGNKCFEIFFFGKDILIMCQRRFWWAKGIYKIFIIDGLPYIHAF